MTGVRGVSCSDCGAELDETFGAVPRIPCPDCGKTGLAFTQEMTATVKVTGWIDWTHTHVGWERNRRLLTIAAVLTIASVLVGYVIAGVLGFIVALLVSAAACAAGAFGLTRVREIERGGTRPPT